MTSTTPSLDEFEQLSRTALSRKPPCRLAAAAETLTDADQTALLAACKQPLTQITTGAILRWLAKRGIESLSTSAITSHRRGTCTCHD